MVSEDAEALTAACGLGSIITHAKKWVFTCSDRRTRRRTSVVTQNHGLRKQDGVKLVTGWRFPLSNNCRPRSTWREMLSGTRHLTMAARASRRRQSIRDAARDGRPEGLLAASAPVPAAVSVSATPCWKSSECDIPTHKYSDTTFRFN